MKYKNNVNDDGYRWIGTVVLLCFTVFVLLMMLMAVWKKSKCLLML